LADLLLPFYLILTWGTKVTGGWFLDAFQGGLQVYVLLELLKKKYVL